MEPYKTKYGPKILTWFKIKNKYQKEMLINFFMPDIITKENLLNKLFKIAFNDTLPDHLDTDELIGKKIGIVIVSKIKKGKSYLNITNFMPIKIPQETLTEEQQKNTKDISTQIATLLAASPETAKQVQQKIKELSKPKPKSTKLKNVHKIDTVINNLSDTKKGKDGKYGLPKKI